MTTLKPDATKFYSGGFLYNPRTRQVLLHKRDNRTDDNPDSWAFFGGLNENTENPPETFAREIKEELGLAFTQPDIQPLCDYFNPDFNTHRHVFFIQIELPKSAMTLAEGADFD